VRVVLQAETGRRAGHKIWLGANQRVFVGGNEWAEFSVPGDPQLADVQFVVESDYRHCEIRNLFAGRALEVNGQKVQHRTLINGDIITAGSTRFRVAIQAATDAEWRESTIGGLTQYPVRDDVPYLAERARSGLFRFYGRDDSQTPTDVAMFLSQQNSFYLVVNVAKGGLELPSDFSPVLDLGAKGEIDASRINACSLLIIAPTDPIDRFRMLQDGWNRDSVFGIFAARERPGIVKSLMRANLWMYPVHTIRDQLEGGEPEYMRELFRGIKAVLVPSSVPGGWEVFAHIDTDPLWTQLGFPNAPSSHIAGWSQSVEQANSSPAELPSQGSSARSGSLPPGSHRPQPGKSARPA
jgi:hypothetical protein